MTGLDPDAIIIGSGAGGAAVAYALVKAGKRVLLLEKGGHLPRDGSTLDVNEVFKEGRFKNQALWLDRHGKTFVPGEYYNVGGKTKWYGAALLRFAPHEFKEDKAFGCLDWPVAYRDLEPYYAMAEALLQVRRFDNEPRLRRLIDTIVAGDARWRAAPLPLGLNAEILGDPEEAKHFDGFASVRGFKADAERDLLSPMKKDGNFRLCAQKEVVALLPDVSTPTRISGVRCADGTIHRAATVILAAGAMTSPRLLQDYLENTDLGKTLPSASLVGANFKMHINSALLAFSLFRNHDLLRKTAIFFNDIYPHSSVQCLGWTDGDILAAQLPDAVPAFVANALGSRAYGFFVTTEDGSDPDNRVITGSGSGSLPVLDYALSRIPASLKEHRALVKTFEARLWRAGMFGVARYMGLAGTAHALGTLVMGRDPATSVVDADGKVHHFDNLYVADGSVLPRSSRVNPALTIYAWGLRLGRHLAEIMKP